ncbi:22356_t:CDS:1, partial [Dentiscutata erythropus]
LSQMSVLHNIGYSRFTDLPFLIKNFQNCKVFENISEDVIIGDMDARMVTKDAP